MASRTSVPETSVNKERQSRSPEIEIRPTNYVLRVFHPPSNPRSLEGCLHNLLS